MILYNYIIETEYKDYSNFPPSALTAIEECNCESTDKITVSYSLYISYENHNSHRARNVQGRDKREGKTREDGKF